MFECIRLLVCLPMFVTTLKLIIAIIVKKNSDCILRKIWIKLWIQSNIELSLFNAFLVDIIPKHNTFLSLGVGPGQRKKLLYIVNDSDHILDKKNDFSETSNGGR